MKLPMVEMIKCNHAEDINTPWMDTDSDDLWSCLQNRQTYLCEARGAIPVDIRCVFNNDAIRQIPKNPYTSYFKLRDLWMFIDPNLGGQSEFAVGIYGYADNYVSVCISVGGFSSCS
jgi:hypothetical protein